LTRKVGFGGEQSVNSTVRNVEEINYLAIKKYVPKFYPGKVTFFSAAEEVCPEESLTGWKRLAQGGVEVVEVPGDHQTMIKEPFVRELARALAESINQSIGNASKA
jgi:thioesterase domain-containing protein